MKGEGEGLEIIKNIWLKRVFVKIFLKYINIKPNTVRGFVKATWMLGCKLF